MLRLPRFSQAKYAERPSQRAVVGAREIAAVGTLDLDHVGAQVGELPRAERRGDGLLQRRPRGSAGRSEGTSCSSSTQNDRGMPSTCSPMYERIRFVEIGAT